MLGLVAIRLRRYACDSKVTCSIPGLCAFLGKLFSHVCLYHQFGTGQAAVMPCGWEGNRRPCVTDCSGLFTYWLMA